MTFKLKSKLDPNKYPCLKTMDEILQWLVFAKSVDPYEIDPVLLGRLGAMAKSEGRKHIVLSGHRSTKKQEVLYINAGGVKNKDGTYSDPDGKVNGKVAKPNRSFHEYRLAIDSGDKYYKSINKTESTYNQTKLNKFGLFKPLTIGNGIKESSCEDWHIQPLETYNLDLEGRKKMMPEIIVVAQPKPLTPIEKLTNAKIISQPSMWNIKDDDMVNGDNCRALFNNFYAYKNGRRGTLEQVMKFVLEVDIISSLTWKDAERMQGKYINIVLERMSKLL